MSKDILIIHANSPRKNLASKEPAHLQDTPHYAVRPLNIVLVHHTVKLQYLQIPQDCGAGSRKPQRSLGYLA